MVAAMLRLHLENTFAKEGHTWKFKLRLSRFTLSDTHGQIELEAMLILE